MTWEVSRISRYHSILTTFWLKEVFKILNRGDIMPLNWTAKNCMNSHLTITLKIKPGTHYPEKACHAMVFTARCYASAVLAMGLCPCLCPSVTSRCSTKTAKGRITHDTPGTLVFWRQRSPRNSNGVTPHGGAKCRWVCQNRRLSTNSRLYLENGKR